MLLLFSIACAAHAEPIEVAGSGNVKGPFTGKMLETFLRGSPPPVLTSNQPNVGAISRKAAQWFGNSEGMGVGLESDAALVFTYSAMDRASEVKPKLTMTEGLYILRDQQGRIDQVISDVLVAKVEYRPKGWEVDMWNIEETEYDSARPGARKPLPGIAPFSVTRVDELSYDPDKGVQETLGVATWPEGGTVATKTTLRVNPNRSLLVREEYSGAEAVPEKLIARETFQRIYWKEGPGLRQLIQRQTKNAEGALEPEEDIEELWKVDPQGVRVLEKTINHLSGR
ncbi:hypothetical protein [Haloferula sp. BvORR071]|uniref:hypothetical protein n=1 Tax=Haloferula sp. BvORR071 TaxID=1396141 RepID=UPI002240FC24|nr:hypothetical protein [Haloferula sp. BvORR071]